MLPGSFHLWEFIEFLYYLKVVGYDDDWFAHDVASKEMDTARFFFAMTKMTRRLEKLTDRLDRKKIKALTSVREPDKSLLHLYDTILPE